MPRAPRLSSESGLYHVTMRGNAKADIFESDEHRQHFLDLLARYKAECHFRIIAWCLMDNHVHLVVDAPDIDISAALQRLATAYAVYYNRMEDRVGHLFQCPFKSKPIEYEEQLVNTVRYVHLNPERAGICMARDYRWSSHSEYEQEPWLVDTSMVMGIVGNVDELLDEPANLDYVVRETPVRLCVPDEAAQKMVVSNLHLGSCNDVVKMKKAQRNKIIMEASRLRLPPSQLARLFGIGERTVYRIIRNVAKEDKSHMTPLKVARMAKGVSPLLTKPEKG